MNSFSCKKCIQYSFKMNKIWPHECQICYQQRNLLRLDVVQAQVRVDKNRLNKTNKAAFKIWSIKWNWPKLDKVSAFEFFVRFHAQRYLRVGTSRWHRFVKIIHFWFFSSSLVKKLEHGNGLNVWLKKVAMGSVL